MRRRIVIMTGLALLSLAIMFCANQKTHPVYMGNEMSSGYDLGVTTDNGTLGWLTDVGGSMKMEYPADQLWGSVFITVGKIKDLPNKPTVDLSEFKKLSFELKADVAEQKLEIGMKDSLDADDGNETKVPVTVGTEWKTYEIDLSAFKTADLKQIYILTEFVFSGANAQTVYFRNIQFK